MIFSLGKVYVLLEGTSDTTNMEKMKQNDSTHEQEGGWLAKTSYALFDVGNSAVGAMHATFIFAVYFKT